jgi:hypothetical protein
LISDSKDEFFEDTFGDLFKPKPQTMNARKFLMGILFPCMIMLMCAGCGNNSGTTKQNSVLSDSFPPLPKMWIAKDTGIHYEKNFSFQSGQLSSYIGTAETDSIFFPLTAFQSMIAYFKKHFGGGFSYIHIYIASYTPGSAVVPAGYEKKLTLIFAPADANLADLGLFSITPSGNFDPSSDSCNLKNNDWASHYVNNEMTNVLVNNLDKSDKVNYGSCSPTNTISDTRSVKFTVSEIDEFLSEISYQSAQNHITTSGIRAFFASYPAAGRAPANNFKNRIFVVNEYTLKNSSGMDEVYYIDDQPDFSHRAKQPVSPDQCDGLMGSDNGHLCPPNCP